MADLPPGSQLGRAASNGVPFLRVTGLHAGYAQSEVLFGIDLEVGRGEIVGVLGRNGMGKTTLVRAVMGLLPASTGRISVAGRDTSGLAPNRIARLGVALVPEGRQVFANLSVEEHLSAFERSARRSHDVDTIATRGGGGGGGEGTTVSAATEPALDPAWTPARAFTLFPRLAERRRHLGHQLSGGEQQMLAIARALVTNPALLILDEATEGLAPLVRAEIWRVLAELRAQGLAMIVIDKYVPRIAALADRCVIVERGRVAWRGPAAELTKDDTIWRGMLSV